MAQANLKCHKQFGYDYFYVDRDKKELYKHSPYSGGCTDYIGKFSSELDLKEKVASSMGVNDDFFTKYPEKWNCEL